MGSEKSADQACCLFSRGFDDMAEGGGGKWKENLYFTWAWAQIIRWMVVVLKRPARMVSVGARRVVQALQFNGKQGVGVQALG